MSIFQRISDIIKSNINDLLDKAEDPEKMVKQIISELQENVAEATQALGKAMSSERIVKRQYDTSLERSEDWEEKAKAALAQGNEDLAKKALANKVKVDESTAQYYSLWQDSIKQTETIHSQVELLKDKLEEAKSKEAMLIARSQMADTKKTLAKQTSSFSADSSLEKFARMEEKIERKEAEADAFAEISNSEPQNEFSEFEQVETNQKVNDELARLKAEMNGSIGMNDTAK